MSSSTGAKFLRELFDHLARKPDERAKEIARWVFKNSPFDCAWNQVFDYPHNSVVALLPDVCVYCWTLDGKHDNCEPQTCAHDSYEEGDECCVECGYRRPS